jgi:hypothetical protein
MLRLLYAVEFLIALIAILLLWTQAAGQAHVDLVYWYWKAGIALAAAYAVVRATRAAAAAERAWNAGTLRWLAALAALVAAAGMVTYYAHLYYEDQSDEETQEEPAVTIDGARAGRSQANSASARSISARM